MVIKEFFTKVWDRIRAGGRWCKKKVKQIAIALGIIGIATAATILAPPTDISTRFDWQNATNEIIEERTHFTKDFQLEGKQRIKIVSLGLLHYYDESFEDLYALPFPEGKEIKEKADRHFMIDLPQWGREELNKDKTVVTIYDKKDQPIYIFKRPRVASKRAKISSSTPVIQTDQCKFEVEDHKLYLKVPSQLKNSVYPLQAFDDTHTTSTNAGDTRIMTDLPTTPVGSAAALQIDNRFSSNGRRTLIKFTTPSSLGTITGTKLYLYLYSRTGSSYSVGLHRLTETAWTEAGATWKTYDGSNAWTGDGAEGDYGPELSNYTDTGSPQWCDWSLGAYTYNWGDTVHLFLRFTVEDSGTYRYSYRAKEYTDDTTKRPYLEITYEEAAVRRFMDTE